MNFEEFQNKARLHVLGALEPEEMGEFEEARSAFGEAAESFINECRKLNSVFALSLRPHPPRPETKQRLLEKIKLSLRDEEPDGDVVHRKN